MSDVSHEGPHFDDDTIDECPPTERDPSAPASARLPRGAALSVLWWMDEDGLVEAAAAER